MTDWKDTLAKFLEDKDIELKLPQFEESEELKIKSFISGTIMPAFEQLTSELNKYGIRAKPVTTVNIPNTVSERISLVILGNGKPSFKYNPKFSISNKKLFMKVQISFLDLKGEFEKNTKEFTPMNSPLTEIDETKIIDDFINAFTKHIQNIENR